MCSVRGALGRMSAKRKKEESVISKLKESWDKLFEKYKSVEEVTLQLGRGVEGSRGQVLAGIGDSLSFEGELGQTGKKKRPRVKFSLTF